MHDATQIIYEKVVTEKMQIRYEKVVTKYMHGAAQIGYEKVVIGKIHSATQFKSKKAPERSMVTTFFVLDASLISPFFSFEKRVTLYS